MTLSFNPPPGWPKPPVGWVPPAGWSPDPSWPDPPEGWQLWLPNEEDPVEASEPSTHVDALAASSLQAPNDNARIAYLEAENAALRAKLEAIGTDEYVVLDDARVLQEVGIYRYHHPLETAAAYQDELNSLEKEIASIVTAGEAIIRSEFFTLNNSLAQGRRMTDDLGKLMLRAYNAEADNVLRTLRAGNVLTAKRRLEASRSAIAKLGKLMEMRISDQFHDLRVREIELTADWLMKKQQEREAERDERARLREEKRVERELAEERARLDKERHHLLNTLAALRQNGQDDPTLAQRLAEVDAAIEQNDYRAANIRAGYVYVISNQGAFGENVVKIGLTRRLEPRDRIYELGGASVPFRFDTHALFFSEDAVSLEAELHRHFADRALNRANHRKEFFFASPSEVREVLLSKVGNILEFTEEPDATEYRQSVGLWPHGR
ncbi:helicase A859L containing protein [Microbacterium laevaniformans OR221]|nr:helicase A859L containing protein [Microbacterium laevaniformans OR221]